MMEYDELKKWYIEKNKLFFSSIELTQNCNFKCRHCFCPEKEGESLPVASFRQIIDKIYSTGCLFLNMTGGEILGYKHFTELYRYAKEKGFIIDLMTNASLLNDEHIKLFKDLLPSNISITLYGTNEDEYREFTGNGDNFFKVMNSLNLLKENDIPFSLRAVATKTLRESLAHGCFDKLADKFSVPFRYDPIIFPKISRELSPLDECLDVKEIVELEKNTGLRKTAWETKIKESEDANGYVWHCHAGENSIFIDFKGNAFVCGIYRNGPISLIDNEISTVMAYLHKIHERHVNIISSNKCSTCEKRKICKWCPAYSFLYNGNENEKVKFFCDLATARLQCFGKEIFYRKSDLAH